MQLTLCERQSICQSGYYLLLLLLLLLLLFFLFFIIIIIISIITYFETRAMYANSK